MSVIDAVILGIIQGITEFLPISSSGHLVLFEHLLGLQVADLKSFDVAVHMGTLAAIIIYFWKDILGLLKAFFKFVTFKKTGEYGNLILFIVIGTIPAVIAGVLFEDQIDGFFRNPTMVAACMIFVGLIFILGEFVNGKIHKKELTLWKAIIIGIAQAIALIPGISRSGSTIVAGLFQGIERDKAARFSFLLGAPAIFGAGLLTAFKTGAGANFDLLPTVIGFFVAALSGFATVSFLMKFLKTHSLHVFAVYLIIMGALLIS